MQLYTAKVQDGDTGKLLETIPNLAEGDVENVRQAARIGTPRGGTHPKVTVTEQR